LQNLKTGLQSSRQSHSRSSQLTRIDRLPAGWVAGWLGVGHTPVCIKTAKPIRKLFQPPESPIILVSSDPCDDTKFHGEPLLRGR